MLASPAFSTAATESPPPIIVQQPLVLNSASVDAIAFVPPTVKRDLQIMKILEKECSFGLRVISIEKIKRIGEKFNLVETNLIISSEEKIMIHYLFSKVDNDWIIFDVLLEGTISEIATKKSEFKKIIDENGVSS